MCHPSSPPRLVALWLAFWIALFLSPAAAQTAAPEAGAQEAGTQETATQEAGNGPSRAGALLEVLRDDAARAALIAELERFAAEGTAAAPSAEAAAGASGEASEASSAASPATASAQSASPPSGSSAAPPRGVGAQLARVTQTAAEEAAEAVMEFFNGLAATQRRLSGLWGARGVDLAAGFLEIALVAASTIVAFVATRFVARRLFARVGSAAAAVAGGGEAQVAAAFVSALLIDAAAVALAWAAGYLVAVAALGETGRIGLNQTLFLNAFLIVEMSKVAIRAVLAPTAARVRVAPLSDDGARSWYGRISALASVLGYGLLLVVPMVSEIVSIFSARAVRVLVYAVVLSWSMILVWRHRAEPHDWLARRSGEARTDATLGMLERVSSYWHWPALIWLVALFIQAVSESGLVAPMLAATGRALGVALVGATVGTLIGRAARRGVRLPQRFAGDLPMLEQRINSFLERVLGAARFIVFAVTLGAAIDAIGLFDVFGWAASTLGADFGGRLLSATLVLLAAFAVWLGFASWVDYRMRESRIDASARERTLLSLLRNAATVAIIVLSGMIALSELGLNIGPLLASAGVLGLAIGFGAQKLVQDVITGVFIQLENAINVGDVVTVGGITGVVEKLTIRSVTLRDLHGVVHVIPFSSVDMVSNFMKGFSFHVADLGIAYREDVADGKAAMQAAFDELAADPDAGRDIVGPMEWFGVNELGDSAVVLRARIRTRPGKQWGIGRAYNELVKKHCDARGVEIPFPHLTVWFGEGKDGSAPPAHIIGETPAPAVR